MNKPALLVAFLALAFSIFTVPLPAQQTEQSHTKWLEERYDEATSVKEGVTLAEFAKIFVPDGGLQTLPPRRYVLRNCSMIKVEVELDSPPAKDDSKTVLPEDFRHEGHPEGKYEFAPNEKFRIKSISRPYLERFSYD